MEKMLRSLACEQGMVRGLHMQEPPKKTAIYAENPRLTDSDAKSLMLTR